MSRLAHPAHVGPWLRLMWRVRPLKWRILRHLMAAVRFADRHPWIGDLLGVTALIIIVAVL